MLAEQRPRDYAQVAKKDYEDPERARQEQARIQLRGAIVGKRDLACEIRDPPELAYPGSARGNTPQKHCNMRSTNTREELQQRGR